MFQRTGPPSKRAIAEQDRVLLKRQRDFRYGADAVAAALARFEEIERIALIGSVARPLVREVPRFSDFRRYGIELWHECKDVDLAVWIGRSDRLREIARAKANALTPLLERHNIGIAHHQVELFFLAPANGQYLGRLHLQHLPEGQE